MTYTAEVQLKFDATWTPKYGSFDDDMLPEEHYLITAPAADLNVKQYFKLFEKFMLCVGMDPTSIRSGAMSLVFNDYTNESEQRKVCKEYELTMDEDLRGRFEEWKKEEEEFKTIKTVADNVEAMYWKNKYIEELYKQGRLDDVHQPESHQYTEEEMDAMCDAAASVEEHEKCKEYNMREAEYYNKRAMLDLGGTVEEVSQKRHGGDLDAL